MLVIAHPDDECMFFGPCLALHRRQGTELFVLCLSNGGFAGLGAVREQELLRSCHNMLQLPAQRVRCVDAPTLRDGMDAIWAQEQVAALVSAARKEWGVDAVLTFDAAGVSGHPNHIAVHHGVRHALRTEPGGGGGCAGFQLRSESLGLKYLGTLGSVLQLLLLWAAGRSAQWVADWDAPGTAWRGMLAHKTQLV
eukprot:TRINITY_DN4411_c0_g1_i5.p2 TRINITY_DN4411_c0_g1~~TRINITY_DN4411_c0_g1_i5.p2  ORF type:complete len:195 (-),score=56.63 TRINITY_DN4411_c0_g1_i5:249-833(-)